MAEVASRTVAEENYRRGIEGIGGPTTYYNCGDKAATGPAIEVAKCLRDAKRRAMATSADWARKWADRMYGGYGGGRR